MEATPNFRVRGHERMGKKMESTSTTRFRVWDRGSVGRVFAVSQKI